MDGGGALEKWEELERSALERADDAASWVAKLYDDKTGFFHVAIERDGAAAQSSKRAAVEETKPLEPNAATSIIQLAIARADALHWNFANRSAWKDLSAKVAMSREAVANARPSVALPLRSFGVLPLFSTAYLAQVLGEQAKGATPETVNPAYAIAIRHLLCAARTGFAVSYSSRRDGLHPFVTYHIARALRILEDLNDEPFAAVIEKAKNLSFIRESLSDFKPVLKAPEIALATVDVSTRRDVAPLLLAIEEATVRELIFATTQDGSMRNGAADVSSIAFAMLTLAECDVQRHAPLLIQTLRNLVSGDFRWPMPVGRPFYSDAKGRALYVPSVEAVNALLIVTLACVDKLSDELFDVVIERTTEANLALLERYVTFQSKASGALETYSGWSTDRAPSASRIDSWTTAQAAEFFANRVNLLRWRKRRHVFAQYNWMRHEQCQPSWDQLVNPDEGDTKLNLKQNIEEALRKDREGVAPVFLLYGPPGTSKTTIASAIAHSREWDLISLSPSDFVSESLDKIEQRSRQIFRDLMAVDKCVIVFDEIDSLLRDRAIVRKTNPGTMIEFVIPSLLPKLQNLRDYARSRDMAVFFISNYSETIDSAIVRGGRIDHHICVLPYTIEARKLVATAMLTKAKVDETHAAYAALMQALEELPRNLVYRDVDRLVQLALTSAPPLSATSLQAKAQQLKLGIQPGTYDYRSRSDAYAELISFLSRVTGAARPDDLSEPRSEEVNRFFIDVQSRSPGVWEKLAREWNAQLRENRS